jgi:hypothetical protein
MAENTKANDIMVTSSMRKEKAISKMRKGVVGLTGARHPRPSWRRRRSAPSSRLGLAKVVLEGVK